jgi:hypothetical protein
LVKAVLLEDPCVIDDIIKALGKIKRLPTGKIRKRLEGTRKGLKTFCGAPFSPLELEKYLDEALDHGRTKAFADIMLARGPAKAPRRRYAH